MSRIPIDIDENKILQLRSEGKTLNEMSQELQVSTATLTRRIAYLRNNEGLLTKYKEFHHLRISALNDRVLADLERDLPQMNLNQKIKLFGMLQKTGEKYEEKEEKKMGKITGLLQILQSIDAEEKRDKALLEAPQELGPKKGETPFY